MNVSKRVQEHLASGIAVGRCNCETWLHSSCIYCQIRKSQEPTPIDVEGIIRSEEELYLQLLDRAPKIIEKIIRRRGLSGETLAFLHDTHGIDPTVVEGVVGNISSDLFNDYRRCRNKG